MEKTSLATWVMIRSQRYQDDRLTSTTMKVDPWPKTPLLVLKGFVVSEIIDPSFPLYSFIYTFSWAPSISKRQPVTGSLEFPFSLSCLLLFCVYPLGVNYLRLTWNESETSLLVTQESSVRDLGKGRLSKDQSSFRRLLLFPFWSRFTQASSSRWTIKSQGLRTTKV